MDKLDDPRWNDKSDEEKKSKHNNEMVSMENAIK